MPKITRVSSAVAALLLASALSGCGSAPAGKAPATVQKPPVAANVPANLSANFDSGTLAGWQETAQAKATAQAATNGKFGVQISANQEPGYLKWSTEVNRAAKTSASLRVYLKVVSRGTGQSLDLLTIKNSSMINNFDFFVTANTDQFKWDLNNANAGQSHFRVKPGRWYLVEVQCDFADSTYTAQVRIDGVDQGTITSAGMKPATVRAVWLGTPVPKTHEQLYDDVALKLSNTRLGFLGGATK